MNPLDESEAQIDEAANAGNTNAGAGSEPLQAVAEKEAPMGAKAEAHRDIMLLAASRIRHLVEVNEPLVIISQVQRSGGTLLSQLFDAHPQCHAHPHELKIGYPRKQNWPPLDLSDEPREWYRMLKENESRKALKRGYQKQSDALVKESPEEVERFPFMFLPTIQWQIFQHCVTSRQPERERDILDAYLTSYFNAWLDNQNLYTGEKKIVTGFTPRLSMATEHLAKFFEAYPDGKLLTMIRNPQGWYVSARKHSPGMYGNIDHALQLWSRSSQAAIEAKEQYGDSVFVLSYDELVDDTEGVMRRIAAYLGIDFDPTLVEPTFNGFPIKADSSFRVSGHGVIKEPLHRHQEELSEEERSQIDERTREIYEQALALKG
jgi:hypothetical protein